MGLCFEEGGLEFIFDPWLSIGDEALETKGLAKVWFELRDLDNLDFMFALRDFLEQVVCI